MKPILVLAYRCECGWRGFGCDCTEHYDTDHDEKGKVIANKYLVCPECGSSKLIDDYGGHNG